MVFNFSEPQSLHLVLRLKASRAYRLGAVPSAFWTDLVLAGPHVPRETGGTAGGPGLWWVLAGGGGAPKGKLVLIGGRAGAAGWARGHPGVPGWPGAPGLRDCGEETSCGSCGSCGGER